METGFSFIAKLVSVLLHHWFTWSCISVVTVVNTKTRLHCKSTSYVLNSYKHRHCYKIIFVTIYSFYADFYVVIFITTRCYASAVLAMGLCLCLSLCVRLSVTSRSSTKTAKHRITQTTPHGTPKTLVFWCQRYARNSTGVTPYEGAECRWGGSKSATFE